MSSDLSLSPVDLLVPEHLGGVALRGVGRGAHASPRPTWSTASARERSDLSRSAAAEATSPAAAHQVARDGWPAPARSSPPPATPHPSAISTGTIGPLSPPAGLPGTHQYLGGNRELLRRARTSSSHRSTACNASPVLAEVTAALRILRLRQGRLDVLERGGLGRQTTAPAHRAGSPQPAAKRPVAPDRPVPAGGWAGRWRLRSTRGSLRLAVGGSHIGGGGPRPGPNSSVRASPTVGP